MKLIHKDNPFFHIFLENVFSTEELKIIFEEINKLKKDFKDSNFTGSAYTDLEILKQNMGMFLHDSETYENLKTIKIIDKCIKKISINKDWENFTFRRLFNSLMWGGELLSCYKNNDYYKPHVDSGIFSLIFFYGMILQTLKVVIYFFQNTITYTNVTLIAEYYFFPKNYMQ